MAILGLVFPARVVTRGVVVALVGVVVAVGTVVLLGVVLGGVVPGGVVLGGMLVLFGVMGPAGVVWLPGVMALVGLVVLGSSSRCRGGSRFGCTGRSFPWAGVSSGCGWVGRASRGIAASVV